MNNGLDINWGEYVRYSDIQSCIDESGSTSVVAIDKNSIRGRVLGFLGDKLTLVFKIWSFFNGNWFGRKSLWPDMGRGRIGFKLMVKQL